MEKSMIIAGLLDIGRKARKEYLERNSDEARQVNEIVMGAASLIGGGNSAGGLGSVPPAQPVPECLEVDDAALLEALGKMIDKRKKTVERDPFTEMMLKAVAGPLALAIPKADAESREEIATLTVAYNRLLGLLNREGAKAEPMAEGSK